MPPVSHTTEAAGGFPESGAFAATKEAQMRFRRVGDTDLELSVVGFVTLDADGQLYTARGAELSSTARQEWERARGSSRG
jgi:hypothetical protein